VNEVVIQCLVDTDYVPDNSSFAKWAKLVLAEEGIKAGVTIRIVDEHEIAELNKTYRNQDKPTNVLAFPFTPPATVKEQIEPVLGDIIICARIVKKEALEQGKKILWHFAHMTIHGVLHLLGFNHQNAVEADNMEKYEIILMNKLGYPDPYG